MSAQEVDEGTALLVFGLWTLLSGSVGYALALANVRRAERRLQRRRRLGGRRG